MKKTTRVIITIICLLLLKPAFSLLKDGYWYVYLSDSVWTLSGADKTEITDNLTLALGGNIQGYSDPNESRWRIRKGNLEILNTNRAVTSKFKLKNFERSKDWRERAGGHDQILRVNKLAGGRSIITFIAPLLLIGVVATKVFLKRPAYIPEQYTKNTIANGLIILWLFVSLLLAALPTYVPDEGWFLIEAISSAHRAQNGNLLKEVFFHDNAFAYGGIWWGVYTTITLAFNSLLQFVTSAEAQIMMSSDAGEVKNRLFDFATPAMLAPMIAMRWLSLISVGIFGRVLIQNAKTCHAGLAATILLLLTPIVWWSGKIASPELLSGALYGLAVIHWFYRQQIRESIVLSTLAIGIKLTIMPAYIALIMCMLWSERRQLTIYILAKLATIAIFVFLLCNLWLLTNPVSGIQQLIAFSKLPYPAGNISERFNLILFSSQEMWEGTNYGSLNYWAGSISFLVLTALASLLTSRAFGLYFVIAVLMQLAFIMTQPPHCWYWFPIIFSAFSAIGLIENSRTLFLYFILAIISVWPFHNSLREISYRTSHLKELADVSNQTECILKTLKSARTETVFDMASIGTSPSKKAGWLSNNFVESYIEISNGTVSSHKKGESLLIVGDRTLANHLFIKNFVASSQGNQENCGNIHLLRF